MSTAGQQEQARPVRQRIGHLRPRSMMARRSDRPDRFTLSPRGRRVAGWLAALILVLGIAAVVRFVGGDAESPTIGAGPSGSAAASGDLATVAFGTALDPVSGEVAEDSRTQSFSAGYNFAYSVTPGASVPPTVYVEVRRTGDGDAGVVQEPVEGQRLPNPEVIAFQVPADDLLEVFGPGEYVMLIYAEPAGSPIAQGSFELVAAEASPAASG